MRGPFISLGRLGHLRVLGQLFGSVRVPHAVLDECMARPAQDDALRIQAAVDAQWLLPCEAPANPIQGLDSGECAAIGLALALRAGLLIDDLAARQYAVQIGLPMMGTLGVLVRAKRAGVVGAIGPLIERLRASGQRLGAVAVAEALRAAGEAGG